jgi:hypothetical protein
MALATDLQGPFVGQPSRVDDLTLGPRRLDMFRPGTMTFFTSDVELGIFGFISSIYLLQLKPCIMAPGTAHFKGLGYGRLLEGAVLLVPVLKVVRDPSRCGLVPLKRKDVVMVSGLHLIPLLPAPATVSSDHPIGHFFGRVFRIHQGRQMDVFRFSIELDNDLRNVSGLQL